MAEQLTLQQKQAIVDRGGKLLVSAAAGSGKTKVLVDRLLSYLTDPVVPAEIDDFLIITYTKAAAAELRGKIADKLSERIAENPENRHLQQQLQRLHLTQISTVHAFCANVLREFAYRLDIPADFRVADEDECLELQMRALNDVMERAYKTAANDENFRTFIDTQGFGRDDRRIPEIILAVYHSAYCHLDPQGWLDWCLRSTDFSDFTDASETIWGRYLINDLHKHLDLQIEAMERCANAALAADQMEKPAVLLASTVDQLRMLRNCNTWDQIHNHRNIDYGRLVFSKKCTDAVLVEEIRAVREACKTAVSKRLLKFVDPSERVLSDFEEISCASSGLVQLVCDFSACYSKLKTGRRVLDFSDLEHRMLDLLLGRSRNGITRIAGELGNRYREVMVDEYQDSNDVQDAIFRAITDKKQNCFMVGDVKQSIYQFRLADPAIFIDKYNRYVPVESAVPGEGRKVILSKNFRSSGAVISAVNDVFSTCMSEQVGGLVYGNEEMLYEGIPHVEIDDQEIALYGLEVQADTYAEEAAFVADRIKTLLDGTHMVRQKDNSLRPIIKSDIVILLRSPGSVGAYYQLALENRGIHCSVGSGQNILETEEIETLMAILQVINNPLMDIPLLSVLLSRVFCFTADDLAQIRASHLGGSIYAALQASELQKVKGFLDVLGALRKEAQLIGISQLLLQIFTLTRIDSIFSALPDGDVRVENLQSFCQLAANYESNSGGGLVSFLEHLDLLSQRGLSSSSDSVEEDCVTIMSIHKSKGLEFPVVFLGGLARDFNQESIRAQVLCDKELGLGLSCFDAKKRIQYPSIAKLAIAAKMKADSISEELRVLYVAMTRAKDRLYMVYSSKYVKNELEELSLRIKMSDPLLITSSAKCPGLWVLMSALIRKSNGLNIEIVHAPDIDDSFEDLAVKSKASVSDQVVQQIKNALDFRYPYISGTVTPSKQTATQFKGREKDKEVQELTSVRYCRQWRKPSFANEKIAPTEYGNAMHTIMQHISFDRCFDEGLVASEILRLKDQGYISDEQASLISVSQVTKFFNSSTGVKIRQAQNVLREFKFSVLTDFGECIDSDDRILLQGVVDCAIIEDDGITVVDFKTDKVNASSIERVASQYKTQIELYMYALSKIYQKPIKSAILYFFEMNMTIPVL